METRSQKRKRNSPPEEKDLPGSTNNMDVLEADTPVDTTAMDNALQLTEILEEIIRPLKYKELMACSLVNKKLSTISSTQLLKLDPRVHLQYSYYNKMFLRAGFENRRPRFHSFSKSTDDIKKYESALKSSPPGVNDHLEGLITLIKISKNFPSSHFIFDGGCLTTDKTFLKFVVTYGHHVKSLQVSAGFHETMLESYPTSFVPLLRHTPNLENVFLEDCSNYVVHRIPDSTIRFQLNSLKYIDWDRSSCRIAGVLLGLAPNLENVGDLDYESYHLGILEAVGKLPCVKEFNTPVQWNYPNPINTFLNGHPKLEAIHLDYYGEKTDKNEMETTFRRIFHDNAESLRNITLEDLGSTFPKMQLPVFSLLNSLSFKFGDEEDDEEDEEKKKPGLCLPHGVDLARSFPVLNSLDVSRLPCNKENMWNEFFNPIFRIETLDSVKTVMISSECVEEWMVNLKELCPNFTGVDLRVKIKSVNFVYLMDILCFSESPSPIL